MKNTIKFSEAIHSIAVITIVVITVLAVTSCLTTGSSVLSSLASGTTTASTTPEPAEEQGNFTITGLDQYNGMFIKGDNGRMFHVCSRVVETEEGYINYAGARITNGTAKLNVIYRQWNDDIDGFQTVPYTESNTILLSFIISTNEFEHLGETKAEYRGVVVEFDNGIAQIPYTELSDPASNYWQ